MLCPRPTEMSVSDAILSAIGSGAINSENISFDLLRSVGMKDHGREMWDSLRRGRNILETPEQLDQYLHSYGPMTQGQWHVLLKGINLPEGAIHVVDYGCGQGLAGSCLLDHYDNELRERVECIELIEISEIALARAHAIYSSYCPAAVIKLHHKGLDEVDLSDSQKSDRASTLNLMSNVLDLHTFCYESLARKLFVRRGTHLIFAVSPKGNSGSRRVGAFHEFVGSLEGVTVHDARLSSTRGYHSQVSLYMSTEV